MSRRMHFQLRSSLPPLRFIIERAESKKLTKQNHSTSPLHELFRHSSQSHARRPNAMHQDDLLSILGTPLKHLDRSIRRVDISTTWEGIRGVWLRFRGVDCCFSSSGTYYGLGLGPGSQGRADQTNVNGETRCGRGDNATQAAMRGEVHVIHGFSVAIARC